MSDFGARHASLRSHHHFPRLPEEQAELAALRECLHRTETCENGGKHGGKRGRSKNTSGSGSGARARAAVKRLCRAGARSPSTSASFKPRGLMTEKKPNVKNEESSVSLADLLVKSCRLNDAVGLAKALKRKLLSSGEMRGFRDEQGWMLVHHAAYAGSLNALKFLIQQGADVEMATGPAGETPLTLAIKSGSVETVRYLVDEARVKLEVYCRPHSPTTSNPILQTEHISDRNPTASTGQRASRMMPAILQVARRRPNVWRFLVDTIRLRALDKQFLRLAALKGHEPIIRFLISQRHVDVNIPPSPNADPPLFSAVKENRIACAKSLVLSGADISVRSRQHWTPREFAQHRGYAQLAEYFLTEEINRGLVDAEEARSVAKEIDMVKVESLHALARAGRMSEIVDIITNNSVVPSNINAKSGKMGRTIVHHAARYGQDHVVRFAVNSAGADPNAIDNSGDTALIVSCRWGHANTAVFLTQAGGKDGLVKRNTRGHSARQVAEIYGRKELAQILQSAEIKAQVREERDEAEVESFLDRKVSEYELRKSVARGSVMNVERLLRYTQGLQIEAVDEQGNTPLHLAATYGQSRIASLLLEAKACVNARNPAGDTPLTIAAQSNCVSVAQVLVRANEIDLQARGAEGLTARQVARGDTVEFVLFAAEEKQGLLSKKEKDEYRRRLEERMRHHSINDDSGALEFLLSICNNGPGYMKPRIDASNPNVRKTALHYALSSGGEAATIWLLEAKANPCQRDPSGRTPLALAAMYGNLGCVAALLTAGADLWGLSPSVTTGSCKVRPVQIARSMGNMEVEEMLFRAERQLMAAEVLDRDVPSLHTHFGRILDLISCSPREWMRPRIGRGARPSPVQNLRIQNEDEIEEGEEERK